MKLAIVLGDPHLAVNDHHLGIRAPTCADGAIGPQILVDECEVAIRLIPVLNHLAPRAPGLPCARWGRVALSANANGKLSLRSSLGKSIIIEVCPDGFYGNGLTRRVRSHV